MKPRCRDLNRLDAFLIVNERRRAWRRAGNRQIQGGPWIWGLCRYWWSQAGSNRRPPACKAGALPAELWPRIKPDHRCRSAARPRNSRTALARSSLAKRCFACRYAPPAFTRAELWPRITHGHRCNSAARPRLGHWPDPRRTMVHPCSVLPRR